MSYGVEAVFSGVANRVMDIRATEEMILERIARQAAAAAPAGELVMPAEAEVASTQPQ